MSLVARSPFTVSSESLFLSAVSILLFTETLFLHLNYHVAELRLTSPLSLAEGILGLHLLSGAEKCHASNGQLLCLSQVF